MTKQLPDPAQEGEIIESRRKPLSGEVIPPRQPAPAQNGGCLNALVKVSAIAAFTLIVGIIIFAVASLIGVKLAQDTANDLADTIFGSCWFDCGPELVVNTGIIIQQIETQAWLEGARATNNIPDLYVSKDRPGPLTGVDALRYNAFVTITAGIDLKNYAPLVEVNGGIVTITLPKPQIRDCILDEQNSYYYDDQCDIVGIGTDVCDGLEDILRERALTATANGEHDALLLEAFDSASLIIRDLISGVDGVDEVIIVAHETMPESSVSAVGSCAGYVETPEPSE